MRTTTDTLTGKPFRWNATVLYCGKVVPARYTTRTAEHLHPDRVPPKLLASLNPARADECHGSDINYEDPELFCDHCGQRIESAYAEDANPAREG